MNDDDDDELQAALQQSLNEMRQRENVHTSQTSTAPQSNFSNLNLESHLTSEEIRQRRLRRFQT